MNPIPCKRCLLAELDAEGLLRSVERRISQIPDELRTPPGEYQRRLAHCTECDMLTDGICAQCGCFAELRAAVITKHCPHVRVKW